MQLPDLKAPAGTGQNSLGRQHFELRLKAPDVTGRVAVRRGFVQVQDLEPYLLAAQVGETTEVSALFGQFSPRLVLSPQCSGQAAKMAMAVEPNMCPPRSLLPGS